MQRGIGEFSPESLARAGVDRTVVDLANAFLQVMNAMGDRLELTAADHDLNAAAALLLRRLDEPVAQRDIAEVFECDRSYVTAIVDRLEALGAVRRRPDPDDRRVRLVELTPTGRTVREQIGIDLVADLPFATTLTLAERAQLLSLLDRALGDPSHRPEEAPPETRSVQ